MTREPAERKRTPAERKRRRRRVSLAILASLLLAATILVARGWVAFGQAPEGARLERMQASAQWDADHFENPQPLWNDGWGMVRESLAASDHRSPEQPVPVVTPDPASFERPPATGLRVTWLGHSTILVEIDGLRVLTDPVWGERTSPFPKLGPRRWYPPPIALDELPAIDVVLISHDHYDHLDQPTIAAIAGWDARFVAPLGVGAHLAYWGVPEDKIVELDWWESTRVGALELTCAPARHASGRQIFDANRTLWAGYALVGPEHRVFFSGDTGLFPGMREIGERLGPFDLTMIEVGAYGQSWPDWHIGPEQAVVAHAMLRGEHMLPVHWGLFDLAFHGWTAPIERSVAAAEAAGVDLLTPRPGESFEPEAAPAFARWWPALPWRGADDYPIVSTKLGELGETRVDSGP